jgi:hypothetical protein
MVIRRALVASFALFGLGCLDSLEGLEPPGRADGLTAILVITTELEPSVREELGAALDNRVEAGGYAVTVSYDAEGLRVLPGCTVPVTYDWTAPLGLGEFHDSDEALFVVAEPGRSDAFVRLDRAATVRFRTQRWAALPDDDLLPDPFDGEPCVGATHVIREFMFGITESDHSEKLVGLWIEPLPDRGQRRWEARKHRGEAAGSAVLSVLSTIGAVSIAVICLADFETCVSGDDDAYANDEDSNQRSLRQRSRSRAGIGPGVSASPIRGTELGRTRRLQVETGAGGFVLRF